MEKKKRNFSQRPAWHRHFHGETLRREIKLTLPARGLLAGLKDLMFAEQGPVENDLESIGRSLGIRDKRTVTKALQELTDKGFIVVTEDGLVHEDSMREIVENSALFAAHGMTGGRPAKKNGQDEFDMSSASDRELIANCSETDTSQPIENIENTEKPGDTIEQKKIKTSPLPPKQDPAKTVVNGNGGGGDSPAQNLIREFDRMVVQFWGENSRRDRPAMSDPQYAGEWLAEANGDFDTVRRAIETVMERESLSNQPSPGSLKFYKISVPKNIATAMKPVTLTASPGKGYGPTKSGSAKVGEPPIWVTIRALATKNYHDDIAAEIRKRADQSEEAANEYALKVEETVKSKKARAA